MPHWDLTIKGQDKFMAVKKLLVADDSLTIQKVIRLALAGMSTSSGRPGDSYDIQAVSDGNDAIQQISLFRPDVVLIDISLPGKSAFQVKRAINDQSDLTSVRFVLMSSAFEKIDEEQANEVVFHGRLTKPFDPTHLREVLQEVLTGVSPKNDDPTTFFSEQPVSRPPEMPDLSREAPSLPPMDFPNDDFRSLLMPPMPSRDGSHTSDDIRSLTESTLVMTGLIDERGEPSFKTNRPEKPRERPVDKPFGESTKDFSVSPPDAPLSDDFQWSVQEHSLKPGTAFHDIGGSNFRMNDEGPDDLSGDKPARFPADENPLDVALPPPSGFSAESSAPRRFPKLELEDEAPRERSREIHRPQSSAPQQSSAMSIPSNEQIEEIIRKQVQEQVESALLKLTQRMLPEVAERIIKQEIRSLLESQP
jgi:two-component system, cell cycle response regulator